MTEQDFFDDILNVESRLQQQGYNDGLKEGAEHGRAEGRGFGMSNGFEKFLESGRLAGKAIVWANRLPGSSDNQPPNAATLGDSHSESLGPLPNNARLEKNIKTLYSLVDPKALSVANSDAAVQDFDDRLKKAQGKERIIERVVTGSAKDGAKAGGTGSSL